MLLLKGFIFLIIIVLFAGAVFVDPAADPPFGPTDFEGQILSDAAAGVREPEARLGDWRPSTVVPLQTLLVETAYRLFGLRLETARGVTGVAAVLVLLLFTALVRRSAGTGTALLAALFLALNTTYFAVARTALPAVLSLLWMLVVIHLWLAGSRSRVLAFLGGAGLVWAGVIENGVHTAFFLGAGALMALFVRLHAWKMPWLDPTRRRLGAMWWGAGVAFALFLARMIMNWDAYGATWGHLWSLDHRLIPSNLVTVPLYFGRLIELMPLAIAVVLGNVLFYAKDAIRPVARHRRLDEIRLWFLSWLLVGSVYFAVVAAPPLDALVLLVPPLCAVAADGLVRLFGLRRFARPRIDVMIVTVLIAGFNWFVLTWVVTYGYSRLVSEGYWAVHQTRGIFLLVLLSWACITPVMAWLYLRWKKFTLPLRPVPVTALCLALGVLIPVLGARDMISWWNARTHTVRDAASELDLPEGALVAGSWAPLLALGGPARAVVIWADVNAAGQDWYGSVTHLLLQDGREADPGLVPLSLFAPGSPEGIAVPVRDLRLGDRRLVLHEVRRLPDSRP